ncbi:MAG: TIGR01458 family HAD-type hydrolase [Pseudomonadota bacterium]
MSEIRGLLIDLGGVVYQGDSVLPGAREAIRSLRAAGMPYRFLTNTTSQPLAAIEEKLAAFDIPVDDGTVFTPALAARLWLRERNLSPEFLIAPALRADFGALDGGGGRALVVGDAREGFTYSALNTAFRHLADGAEFLALASNRCFMDADGAPSLDMGAFVAALEYASGSQAVVLGKPAEGFFHMACADMGLDPSQIAMIGDDAEFDALAARKAGLKGFVVRTGKWSPEALDGLSDSPDAEFEDLPDAIRHLLGGT